MTHTSKEISRLLTKAILRPSGDQAGSFSITVGLLVTLASARPLASMVKMSPPPEVRLNASLLPSGDQAGDPSAPGPVVSRAGRVPSGRTAWIRSTPRSALTKAIWPFPVS